MSVVKRIAGSSKIISPEINEPGIAIPLYFFYFLIIKNNTVNDHGLLQINLHHFFGPAADHIKSNLVPATDRFFFDIRCDKQIVMHHIPPVSFTVQAATEGVLPAEFLLVLQ